MGRAGALPSVLGKVHRRWQDALERDLADHGDHARDRRSASARGSGRSNQFGFVGIFQTLGLVLVYSMGNLGAFLLLLGRAPQRVQLAPALRDPARDARSRSSGSRTRRSRAQHLLHPKSFIDYPFWVALVWIVIGVVVLIIASRTGKEAWLMKAGQSAHLRLETPEELAHEPRHLTSGRWPARARIDAPAAAARHLRTRDSTPRAPDLAGLGIAVTGAAGDIGRAMALELAARGAAVTLIDRASEPEDAGSLERVRRAAAGRVLPAGRRDRPGGGRRGARRHRPARHRDRKRRDRRVGTVPRGHRGRSGRTHLDINLTGCFNVGQAAARLMVGAGAARTDHLHRLVGRRDPVARDLAPTRSRRPASACSRGRWRASSRRSASA